MTGLPRPLRRAAERLGVQEVIQLGGTGSTLLLRTPAGAIVAKRLSARRDAAHYRAVLGWLANGAQGRWPQLLDAVPADDGSWYGLFEYIEAVRRPIRLAHVLQLLDSLRRCSVVPPWRLERWWLDSLSAELRDDPLATHLIDQLHYEPPRGAPVLTHGDFSVANLVTAEDGPALIDWEEMGAASPGFDAGWLLALARAGVPAPWTHELLRQSVVGAGVPAANLVWFERLGVLRLLYRARLAAMPEAVRPLVVAGVAATLRGLEDSDSVEPLP